MSGSSLQRPSALIDSDYGLACAPDQLSCQLPCLLKLIATTWRSSDRPNITCASSFWAALGAMPRSTPPGAVSAQLAMVVITGQSAATSDATSGFAAGRGRTTATFT